MVNKRPVAAGRPPHIPQGCCHGALPEQRTCVGPLCRSSCPLAGSLVEGLPEVHLDNKKTLAISGPVQNAGEKLQNLET